MVLHVSLYYDDLHSFGKWSFQSWSKALLWGAIFDQAGCLFVNSAALCYGENPETKGGEYNARVLMTPMWLPCSHWHWLGAGQAVPGPPDLAWGFSRHWHLLGCNSMCWKPKIRHLRWWWGWELLTVPGLLKYFTGKAVSSMCFSSTCFQMPNYIWTPFLHISSKEKSHSSLNTLLLRNLFLKFSGFITQILLWIALCPPVRA